MKKIPLTQGQFAIVDDGDYEFLIQWKWNAWWNRETKSYYARRGDSDGNTYLMHRVVASTPQDMICDHKNHNTLDNRKNNLRNVTHVQSNMNRKPKHNVFGEPNIRPMGRRFEVRIQSGEYKIRESYYSLDDAISARDKLIKSIQGEFAYTGEQS